MTPDDARRELAAAPPDPAEAIAHARAQLQQIRTALTGTTGGAPPRAVLAELAQGLAAELATHFDDLPMHPFTGRVPRAPGTWGWLVPPRAVPHRVVLGRYLSLTVPQNAGSGYTVCGARIAVVGLGADGVLRRGELWEMITLPEGVESTTDALPWDDMRLRRVPSRAIRLVRWGGDAQAGRIASPAEVIDALTRVASAVADVAARDLALLDRLMGGAAR